MIEASIWREHGTPLLGPTSAGPLDGAGVAVKDLFAVGGFRVGAGNPTWLAQAQVEPADAWAVRALRAAGACVVGIAQTDELAFSLSGANAHYGTPPNPAAPELVTGGSSSGPAAAVATGDADIGLGTDTAGSIRVPASVCGLYGMRPTHGAVPVTGVLGLAPAFDTVGWLTRDAGMLHAVGSVLLPPASPVRPDVLRCPVAGDIAAQHAAAGLELELSDEPIGFLDDLDDLLTAFGTVQAAEAWALRGQWIEANPGVLATDVEGRFRLGADVDAGTRRRAEATIAELRARAIDELGDSSWLLLPAAGGPGHARSAVEADRNSWRQATLRQSVPASAFGLPSCVLPGNASPPLGWALIGPPGSDRALLGAVRREPGRWAPL